MATTSQHCKDNKYDQDDNHNDDVYGNCVNRIIQSHISLPKKFRLYKNFIVD